MTRWGMVIDLRKCVGCQTCTIMCKQTNNLPPGVFWRRVADCEVGHYPDVQRVFLPMGCMHCRDAPCLEVCPTTATYRRPDGIVDIHYGLCIGCGYCIVACPYLARTIIFEQEPYYQAGFTAPEMAMADPERVGVCTKCNLCLPRVEAGLAQGLQPGIDFEATPACVGACISNALHFGDLNDLDSPVSRLIRENKTSRILEELGTDPGVYYIVE
ncbi:MAG: 4Fe-4S dicluster domain-containing protein [Ardenticatenaceae bacterium]|nr:4Fe-4S dicluster domain-containing protein [Ardenticatenaceae bacterium]HBY92449.1 4Fe-4S ferredoxin [Chloroflexota bacterium]